MKNETLLKANQLKERIDNLEMDLYYATESPPGPNHIIKPEDVLRRSYDVSLNEADAEKLRSHIQRFINNLRKKLKSEFDSLK